ncbi:MAG TPA: hypothetical protein VKA40_10245 [Nitrososphaera sp.]|nr:hypothetical protein [Nitrososphaera sp.]
MAVQLTFAFVACILLTILCWETTISVDDTLSSKATAAAGPVAYAQTTDNTNSATSSNSEDVDAAVANNKNITTFSGIGQISSLVITVPESGFNITDAFKVILTGEWNLNVRNGNVTEFAVNFLASPMDGSKPHIHQITDFRPYDNSGEPIALTRDYSSSVTGTADIKINGVTVWEDADVSISISKGNTFIFDPDDLDTEDHFGDQQVYGIVTGLFS